MRFSGAQREFFAIVQPFAYCVLAKRKNPCCFLYRGCGSLFALNRVDVWLCDMAVKNHRTIFKMPNAAGIIVPREQPRLGG